MESSLGCGKILRNSDMRLIANDFPTESKVFRRLMNDSLSTRPCPQVSNAINPGDLPGGKLGRPARGYGRHLLKIGDDPVGDLASCSVVIRAITSSALCTRLRPC
jgi:hypothetical protein